MGKRQYIRHNDQWVDITGSNSVAQLASAPATASDGDLYYNTTENNLYGRINGVWVNISAAGVTSVTGTAPIASSGGATPAISIAAASTSVVGAVQLSDSISTTSSVLAATPTAVKTSYDLAATKAKVSVGTAAPVAPSTGDVWVDTAGTATAINAVPLAAFTSTGSILYGGGVGTASTLAIGTAGQVLGVAAGLPSWTTLAAAGADVQEFTSSGSWVKPAGKSAVFVFAVGAGGGGGGGGRHNTANAVASGGCGGAGGIVSRQWLQASELAGTVTITIGSGGAGGTSAATETAGNTSLTGGSGANGGDTSFGTAVFAKGGTGGIFGYESGYNGQLAITPGAPIVASLTDDSNTNTAGAGTSTQQLYDGTVIYNRVNAGMGVGYRSNNAYGYASADNILGCAGGGGGGGRDNSADNTGAGGAGGRGLGLRANAAADGGSSGGGANAGNGANAGTATPYIGNGGGGGGGANGVAGVYNAGNGGSGSRGGGGGGGGGVRTNTNSVKSGRGGNGGAGYILVISV
jgi:hypothetical protein